MKKYLLILMLLLIWHPLFAQNQGMPLITVDFNSAGIKDVVTELEAKSGYRFFYDETQFDSLKVSVKAANQTLGYILDKAFQNSDYHYAITVQTKRVYLTRGTAIYTGIAAGYFDTPGNKTITGNLPYTPITDNIPSEKPRANASTADSKLYEAGIKTNDIKTGKATLSGYVRSAKTGAAIAGASIYVENTTSGVITDKFGYYTIALPRGRTVLDVKATGMKDSHRQVILYSDGTLNIDMLEEVTILKEVKVSERKVANVRSTELSVSRLDIKSIKQVPVVFGEADVLRIVLTLPGVQTVGEATTGFNVRGGAADQNLILLNDQTIYNPSHFFGFFSAFNPDIVKDIELYKSSIPEKFGGRLSSVLEVTDREGNKKNFTGSAGIGLLTSRFNIEGPIVKDKTSFIFGARSSYSDWLLNLLPNEYKHSHASFYDGSFNISHQIDAKNNIYLNTYISNDDFKLNSDTNYNYHNRDGNIKWKHNFNSKVFSLFTVGYDSYGYQVKSNQVPENGYKLNFGINQPYLKGDFTYYISDKHTLSFGINSLYYKINPGDNEPYSSSSLLIPDKVPTEQALESALYIGDKFDVSQDFSISAGIRYSIYNYLGPATVDHYAAGAPRIAATQTDSTTYGKNKVINTYSRPEIRVSARYNLSDDLSVKAGYNTMAQYIHLLSNSTAISPIDVYKLSDPNIKPQYGSQISVGLFKNALSNTIEASIEGYYKHIDNYLDYKSSAKLLLNHNIERDVLNTEGKAYGIELSVRKNAGKLNGWINYTYSRTMLRQDDPNAGELINEGKYYPANYDKPHSFNFTGNYRFTHRYSVSLNLTYSTGRPITLPVGKYYAYGAERVLYSDRNAYRIPDYFRSDFSLNIDGNHKVNQRFHNSWTIGVYNLTGRQNAYSTFFQEQGGVISEYQLSIFAKPIPFINYNIRF